MTDYVVVVVADAVVAVVAAFDVVDGGGVEKCCYLRVEMSTWSISRPLR